MRSPMLLLAVSFGVLGCGDDANPPVTDDGAVADGTADDGGIDAPPDGAVGIACGTETCTGTDECCVQPGAQQMCVAAGTCQTTTFTCDGPEDCATTESCCPVAGGGTQCTTGPTCQVAGCQVMTDCPNNQMCCTVGMQKVCAPQCPMM